MVDLATALGVSMRDVVVLGTIVFFVGLIVARLLVRQPVRAHAVLTLTFVGAILAPAGSEIVRRCGWGILSPPPAEVAVPPSAGQNNPSASAPLEYGARSSDPIGGRQLEDRVDDLQADRSGGATVDDTSLAATPAAAHSAPAELTRHVHADDARGYSTAALPAVIWIAAGLWLAASFVVAWRLARGVIAGRRLLAEAMPCWQPEVASALTRARMRLGLEDIAIDAYQSPRVRCPVIWCWGKRPRLLLPAGAVDSWSAAQWTPILCHELAHWKRRDHWAATMAELVCCLLPWQVLAWWAKRRLEQASEQACDDWTVAAGHSAPDYAETLLGLAAQADPPLALAALRHRSGLASRVRHILTQTVPRPQLGRLWVAVVLVVTLAGVGTAALCQRGVARAEVAATETSAVPADKAKAVKNATKTASHPADDESQLHTVFGRVLTPEGQPAAGVDVFWEGTPRIELRGLSDYRQSRTVQFARTKTDADGRFRCEATFSAANLWHTKLILRSAEFGLRSRTLDPQKLGESLEFTLEPTYPIEGTIYSPNGEPVVGAQVILHSLSRRVPDGSADKSLAWYLYMEEAEIHSDERRDFWPAPLVTDEEGRFRLEQVVPRSASAEIIVAAKDYAPVRLPVAGPDAHRYQPQVWRDPKFALVLEQPFVVHGQFLDEKTGKGIAGVHIDVMPMSYERGGHAADRVRAISDAEGRYTLRVGSSDSYSARADPPLGYAGLRDSLSLKEVERMAVKPRQINFPLKLRPGKILHGRVVAEDTGEPVAGVEVAYRALRGRSLGVNNDFQPVTTTADGAFELTGADGKGFLVVDAPNKGFYRLHLDDTQLASRRGGIYPHGYLEINVAADGKSESYTIALRRGTPLIARVVGPQGQPSTKLMAAYVEQDIHGVFQSHMCKPGEFRIDAAKPGQMYRVFLYSADAKAGKVAELVAPADGQPFEIKLEPCATIRGRYVYDNGIGVPEVSNFSRFRIDPDKGMEDGRIFALPFYDNFTQDMPKQRVTDEQGNFVLDNIVPGVFMYLNLNYRFAGDKDHYVVGTLAPGEVKDLGNLVIRPN